MYISIWLNIHCSGREVRSRKGHHEERGWVCNTCSVLLCFHLWIMTSSDDWKDHTRRELCDSNANVLATYAGNKLELTSALNDVNPCSLFVRCPADQMTWAGCSCPSPDVPLSFCSTRLLYNVEKQPLTSVRLSVTTPLTEERDVGDLDKETTFAQCTVKCTSTLLKCYI